MKFHISFDVEFPEGMKQSVKQKLEQMGATRLRIDEITEWHEKHAVPADQSVDTASP